MFQFPKADIPKATYWNEKVLSYNRWSYSKSNVRLLSNYK